MKKKSIRQLKAEIKAAETEIDLDKFKLNFYCEELVCRVSFLTTIKNAWLTFFNPIYSLFCKHKPRKYLD